MLVDEMVVRNGVVTRTGAPGRIRRSDAADGSYQWLVLSRPGHQELATLGQEFGVHRLALEDAGEEHQRPKLEWYDDVALLVVKTLRHVAPDQPLATGEVNLFVGDDFVVTVLHGDAARPGQDGSAAFMEQLLDGVDPDVLVLGPAAVVHAVCDHVVDGYEVVGEALSRDVDDLDDAVFDMKRDNQITTVHFLRRQLADVRRATTPLQEPLARMAESPRHPYPRELSAYLRDVGDHLHRLCDTVDRLESLVGSSFDAYAALISLRQNEDMRRISAWAALVVVPTLIAGVYGMNFRFMPELGWRFGYAYALGLMGASMVVLYSLLKRANWL